MLLVMVTPVPTQQGRHRSPFNPQPKNHDKTAGRMAATATTYELLLTALTEATRTFGGKQRLVRYLRDYYFDINTTGDLIVNEMIDIFESHMNPTATMFAIQHPDTELVELCARHIAEEALASERIGHTANKK
jgi:hypothetical protein